jgi:hypothetical protein
MLLYYSNDSTKYDKGRSTMAIMNEKRYLPLSPAILKELKEVYGSDAIDFKLSYTQSADYTARGQQSLTRFGATASSETLGVGSFAIYPDPSCCGNCLLSGVYGNRAESVHLLFKMAELAAEKVMLRGIIFYTDQSDGYNKEKIKAAKKAGWKLVGEFKNLNHPPYSILQTYCKILTPTAKKKDDKDSKAQIDISAMPQATAQLRIRQEGGI